MFFSLNWFQSPNWGDLALHRLGFNPSFPTKLRLQRFGRCSRSRLRSAAQQVWLARKPPTARPAQLPPATFKRRSE